MLELLRFFDEEGKCQIVVIPLHIPTIRIFSWKHLKYGAKVLERDISGISVGAGVVSRRNSCTLLLRDEEPGPMDSYRRRDCGLYGLPLSLQSVSEWGSMSIRKLLMSDFADIS